jgi:23S rRNA pseudouridine2605 synthase
MGVKTQNNKGARKKTLDRVLSQAGLGSRTEARQWIAEGRVAMNGKTVRTPDTWVDPARDGVTLDGRPLEAPRKIHVLLYKPKGYVTTYKDPQGRPTVYDLLEGVDQFVGTVGRLDQDSSGLLLLTNDTTLADAITSPESHVSKKYLVKTATLMDDAALEKLRHGIELADGSTRPAVVGRLRDGARKSFLEITLTEGRNRQVRRMIEAAGSGVLKLVRTAIGPIEIGTLEIGKWRLLTREEVAALRRAVRR